MALKQCTKCREELDETLFWRKKDKYGNYKLRARCKDCTNIDNRIHFVRWYKGLAGKKRIKNAERIRVRANCLKKLAYHIKTGKIRKRNSCEFCYNGPTECHHEDYTNPLGFIEMCNRCHKFLHRKYTY